MMITQTAPLTASSSSGSVQWKTQNAASAAGVFQPTGAAKDSVSVSKLGQALSGVAADAFKHLDSKARSVLENLVNSGRISADDAVRGLRALATEATFNRYANERPRDQEDVERSAAWDVYRKSDRALSDRMGAAVQENREATKGFMDAFGRGELTTEQFQEKMKPADEKFKAEMTTINRERETLGEPPSLEYGYQKIVKGFNAAMEPMISEDGFTEPFSQKEYAAGQKLVELGFDMKVYGKAFQNFAATVDIPGIGRKAGATAPNDEPTEPPTSAPTTPATLVAASTVPESSAPAVTAQGAAAKITAADPGNAQAALSLLQSAMASGAQKSGSGDGFGATTEPGNTATNSLLEALKAGSGKAGIGGSKPV